MDTFKLSIGKELRTTLTLLIVCVFVTSNIAFDSADYLGFSGSGSESFNVTDNCTLGDVRLSDFLPYHGRRVEICINDQWGTVCNDSWSDLDAQVVCRQLGFQGGVAVLSGGMFGPGDGPIWLDNVDCSGFETALLRCPHNGLGVHNCVHSQDAAVDCSVIPTPTPPAVMCPLLENLTNGTIAYAVDTVHNFTLGTVATHSCDGGFTLVGNVTRTCEQRDTLGVWSGPAPICESIMCPLLENLTNGAIVYAVDTVHNFTLGTVATHSCDPGFTLVGNVTRTCEQRDTLGVWSGATPICESIMCPLLENLTNGAIVYAVDTVQNFTLGTVATHSCDGGFTLVGNVTRTCEQRDTLGVWSGAAPICEPIMCPLLENLTNGAIVYAVDTVQNFTLGIVATHSCDLGFSLVGNATRTCDQRHTLVVWSGAAPICESIMCPLLENLTNGAIVYAVDTVHNFTLGTVATHSCDPGFTLVGNVTRTCEQRDTQGVWSGAAPICESVMCPMLENLTNGAIVYAVDTVQNFTLGTVATHSCDPGFTLVGNVTRTCEQRDTQGVWSGAAPICESVMCPMLENLTNGAIVYAVDTVQNFTLGTVATHSCDLGFSLVGNATRTCEQRHTLVVWSGAAPICESIMCPMLENLTNGAIVYDVDTVQNFTLGTVATHSCNGGFTLVGNVTRTCEQRDTLGVWSGAAPICESVMCPMLENLTNGAIVYAVDTVQNFTLGTVATHSCDLGFSLVGNATRTCEQRHTLVVWSGAAPICESIMCPLLEYLINGAIVYAVDTVQNFTLGTVATHSCDPGFTLVGNATRTCEQRDTLGVWSGDAPICESIMCPMLENLTNGAIVYAVDTVQNFALGTVATHSCDPGFTLVGNVTRTCEQRDTLGVWSGATPTCEIRFVLPTVSVSGSSTIIAGGNVTLICANSNIPGLFNLVWLDNRGTILSLSPMADIIGIQRSQAGEFECRLTMNVNGNITLSGFLTITVLYPPDIVSQTPSSLTVPYNENVTLWCVYDSVPLSIVSWFENGQQFVDGQHFVRITDAPSMSRSQLDVSFLKMDSNYSCLAMNGVGYDTAMFVIHVQVTCPEDFSAGIFWPETLASSTTSIACTQAGSRFRSGTTIIRTCLPSGVWSEVDFTSCTLDSASSEPFLIVYFSLIDLDSGLPFGPDNRKKRAVVLDEQTLLTEMRGLLTNLGTDFSMVSVLGSYQNDNGLSVSFEIILANENTSLANIIDYVTNGLSNNGFAGFSINQNAAIGLMGVSQTESCECGVSSDESIGSGLSTTFLELCVGLSLSPCNCSVNGGCQCRTPYVGDGSHCTLDSDGDGYPDVALDSQVCLGMINTPYCRQDVCPSVSNVDQDPTVCQPVMNTTVFTGCPFGRDPVWNIEWPNTGRGNTSIQNCPGELDSVTGQATRFCDNEGVWSEPDVLECQEMEFVELLEQVSATIAQINTTNTELIVEQTVDLTMQLAVITEPDEVPILPTALNATNDVLGTVLNVLEEVGNNTVTEANEFVIDVLNNVLDGNNTQGWMALQESDAGSQVLLENAERFGVLLARSQNSSGATEPQRFSRKNIAISAKQYDSTKDVKMEDLTFPQEEDLVNYSLSIKPAEIQIPPGLLQERLSEKNVEGIGLPIVFILFQNLEAFLPSSVGGLSNNTHGASVVISSQVGERGATRRRSQLLEESPLSLNFTFNNVENASVFCCVYWNFSEPIGNGKWISDGVSTLGNTSDGLTSTVQCASTHLTSFAVLVDVAGGLQNISQAERTALQVVSYVGCGISVICLLVTVIFFLCYGKQLFITVHYFVHFNLSLSLLLAYIVFMVGVETAARNVVACAFVAALLHYLFLCSFCWMMCEGVMLYLLLVVVFSRVAKTWWFFLLLGYLTPIPFVVITLAARWQYYGVKDASGNLQFCWLSSENGTIFGFVAPMLMIILINVVFLVFALRALWKSKTSQVMRQFTDSEKNKRSIHVAKSVLLATVVLLPVLGLTWVFGLLTINSNTTVFAWIFTVLNSLQGAAILFFHVLRSEKVRSKIGPKLKQLKRQWSQSTLMRYELYSGSSTFGRRHKKPTNDSDLTLRSTLPSQDGSFKQASSSSTSEHHSESEFITETKVDLTATERKLPPIQEEGYANPLARERKVSETWHVKFSNPRFTGGGEVIENQFADKEALKETKEMKNSSFKILWLPSSRTNKDLELKEEEV